MMRRIRCHFLKWTAAALCFAASQALGGEIPAGTFVEVAADEVGGHYVSQVIYAPTIDALVSWGTRTHSKPVLAHETQHFPVAGNKWIDAFPPGKQDAWAGKFKRWPDWGICHPTGRFYQRDGVTLPRPNNTFYQVCWDGHTRRLLFYVGSMTFAYEPKRRAWREIHAMNVKDQPPALLLWSSLCYDPAGKQAILFGGGGIDAPDGRPHTWAFDVTTDTWRRLELAVEPPARCNSRMVYDKRNSCVVLFGGDGQDRGLADTWVFDVTKQRWEERKPPRSPHPRSCHALAYLEKSGVILLAGGVPVCDYRQRERLGREVWTYNAATNAWTPLAVEAPKCHWASMENLPGTDDCFFVTASRYGNARTTYRFRYSPDIPVAKTEGFTGADRFVLKTERTPEWYAAAPPADAKAHAGFLARLPANEWVEARPPKSAKGRTWGTAIFDTDRGVAMKWGGGHSGYQGTDMAFYDVAANRFTIDRTPAFTPEPFGTWARRPAGRTFFNQPWTRHMRHTCAYDRVRKIGVFTDAGGSEWYDRDAGEVVKHTWLYDPAARKWLEPIPQPFPGGGSVSPIAVPTPKGVLVYQHAKGRIWEPSGEWYRFVGEAGRPDTWGWEAIETVGPDRPRQHEHMTIVYDSKRDRLIFLSEETKDGPPVLWFFSLSERRWVKNPRPAPGGVTTREAVYVPDADAILAYGPDRRRRDSDSVWTRVYLCMENRWVPLTIKTPQYLVHEVGLVYDPGHQLAVLMWPPRFERDMRPHLFRLDASNLPRE